jgi:serine/threonine-protein kinase
MAMEYVRGQSLDRWSRSISNASDPLKRRLLVAVQLADALNGAHETVYTDELGFEVRGVLHGDMKPANVLVSATEQAKLLDFLLVDIQRLLDPRVVPPEYTARRREFPSTAAFGTPGFMAPEQEASGLITVRTDIFGLGVTLCYLFEPKGDHWSWRGALHDKALPDRLRDLLRAMIDPDVGERPQNMRVVLAELQAVYGVAYEGTSLSRFLDRLRLGHKAR